MRILITGISGFTGSHLAEYLLDEGKHEVYGMIRWRSDRQNIISNVLIIRYHIYKIYLLSISGIS